ADRAGAHGDGAGEGAAAHLVDPHDQGVAAEVEGEPALEVVAGHHRGGPAGGSSDGGARAHGAAGTSANASPPDPSPSQRPIGQNTTTALPVTSSRGTKASSPLTKWYAE